MNTDREGAILAVAEEMIRQGGYHSFSFRNIADRIGIKSSSVHYHFASKEELGIAIARHYTDSFIHALGCPITAVATGAHPASQCVKLIQQSLENEKGMCLCGMFGTQAGALPESVAQEARRFFNRNITWLEQAYQAADNDDNARQKAVQTASLLQGAMLLSNALKDPDLFQQATASLLN